MVIIANVIVIAIDKSVIDKSVINRKVIITNTIVSINKRVKNFSPAIKYIAINKRTISIFILLESA